MDPQQGRSVQDPSSLSVFVTTLNALLHPHLYPYFAAQSKVSCNKNAKFFRRLRPLDPSTKSVFVTSFNPLPHPHLHSYFALCSSELSFRNKNFKISEYVMAASKSNCSPETRIPLLISKFATASYSHSLPVATRLMVVVVIGARGGHRGPGTPWGPKN